MKQFLYLLFFITIFSLTAFHGSASAAALDPSNAAYKNQTAGIDAAIAQRATDENALLTYQASLAKAQAAGDTTTATLVQTEITVDQEDITLQTDLIALDNATIQGVPAAQAAALQATINTDAAKKNTDLATLNTLRGNATAAAQAI